MIASDALLLRTVPTGESNVVATFFTEAAGKLSAVAVGARRSRRRFAVLEPLHTLRIEVADEARELAQLRSVTLAVPRAGYLSSLARIEAATRALAMLRDAVPERHPEPELWADVVAFLDAAEECPEGEVLAEAAAFGVRLVTKLGWALPPSVRPGADPARALRAIEDAVRANVS